MGGKHLCELFELAGAVGGKGLGNAVYTVCKKEAGRLKSVFQTACRCAGYLFYLGRRNTSWQDLQFAPTSP